MIRYYRLFRTFKNWWLYLLYKFGFAVGQPMLFKTRNGLFVEVPRRLMHTFKAIFVDAGYMIGMGKAIPSNATIIDIGANAGYFTIYAASKYPRALLLAYEPIPVNYAQLERHRDLNRAHNIRCFPTAVSGHCGTIELFFDSSDSFTTSATILPAGVSSQDCLSVSCTTLQNIFDDNQIEKCDLLKIDCEGAEYDILYSCTPEVLKRVDQIAMEVHRGKGENQNINALDYFLREQGFSTRRRPVGKLWAWRP